MVGRSAAADDLDGFVVECIANSFSSNSDYLVLIIAAMLDRGAPGCSFRDAQRHFSAADVILTEKQFLNLISNERSNITRVAPRIYGPSPLALDQFRERVARAHQRIERHRSA